MNEQMLDVLKHVVVGYVSNNPVPAERLPTLIEDVASALKTILLPERHYGDAENHLDSGSVSPDYVVCLEDGKPFKSLKHHLMSSHGMTPEQYREKWGLPPTYPMVAPNYSRTRSAVAKRFGLGGKPQRSTSKSFELERERPV